MTRKKNADGMGKPPVPPEMAGAESTPAVDETSPAPQDQPAAEAPSPEAIVTAPLPVIQKQGATTPSVPASTEEEEADRQAYLALERHRAEIKHRKVRRRVILGIVAAVIVVLVIVANALGSAVKSPLLTMSTATVTRGDFTDVVSGSGPLEPVSSKNVTPEVDGIIDTVSVSAGDTVQEGDVLFTLKNDTLDKAVNDAAQQVKSAQNGVDTAQAGVDQAVDAYNEAVDAYNTAIAAGQTATFQKSTLQGAIDNAELQRESANIALETAQQAYDEAVATADKRTVRAPSSGSIIAMNAVAGTAVSSGVTTTTATAAPLIQIADTSQMTVTVPVNEVDISKIAVGQTAKVTFGAVDGLTLDATVQSISNVATTSTATSAASTSGVVTYNVKLLIANPDPRLKSGMTADVSVTTQSLANVLTVSATAVQKADDGTSYLEVLTDPAKGTTERHTVTVTAKSSTTAVVEGDVSEGDVIVLSSGSSTTSTGSEG